MMGIASTPDIKIKIMKFFESKTNNCLVLAPMTFLKPTSLVLCSTVSVAMANNPKQATIMAKKVNVPKINPKSVSAL